MEWYWYIIIPIGTALLLWLPGIYFHELYHVIGASVANCKIVEFKPFPHLAGGRFVWGSMRYDGDVSNLQRAQIAIAPVVGNTSHLLIVFLLNATISDPIVSSILLGAFVANSVDGGNNMRQLVFAKDLSGHSDAKKWARWTPVSLSRARTTAILWFVAMFIMAGLTVAFFLWR